MDGTELPRKIAEVLDRGATVVTGNQRAARTLRRAFDRRNKREGLASWLPANVVAWDAWTANLWHRLLVDGHASRLLMNRTQEHAIWRRILSDDTELRSLQSKDSLAEMAADAWQTLCSYCGQSRLRSAAAGQDARAFRRWAIEFQRQCRNSQLLSQAEVEDALCEASTRGELRPETDEIVLVGFDRMTPAQTALVEGMRVTGLTVKELNLATPIENRLLVSAADEQDEIAAAARWTRTVLEKQPGSRIGIIVPALEKYRAEIGRVFREVLAPELESITSPEDAGPFEFSIGVPLAHTSMIAAALDLLRWVNGPLPVKKMSALLLSPYFAMAADERNIRAEFDAFELRKTLRLRPEISLDWLSRAVEQSPRRPLLGRLPAVLRAMRFAVATRFNQTEQRSHAHWAERIRELLEAARWAAVGESSVEFQIRRKWEDALDELATLDFDGSRVEFIRALESLEKIAEQTMFAPESRETPVQIMGPLEAAGATFDAIWFLHAGNLTWPTGARSSPLIPWQLRRDLGIPGTDVARDSENARKTTERIAASAPKAIFSYPRETAEGKQNCSSSLDGISLHEADVTTRAPNGPERSIVELETFEDTAPVQALPDRVIRGGAQVLKLQAACGFRAFAEQRLWSTDVEQPDLGMDARQTGNAVHRVLEIFWDEVKTQRALKAMSVDERVSLLDRCIAQAIEKNDALRETQWDAAYMQMQRERLRRLLGSWLELELERSPFEVKLSEKTFDDVRVGPLRLRVRVDRVDLVEGGEVLIDYKTGTFSPNAWLTDRPDEPQLPLYAMVSYPEHLQGVAFGLVRPGDELKLIGYEASDGILPHARKMTSPSLDEQVDNWHRVLSSLATDFSSGEANVAPKKYPSTCEHCAQRVLCRLDVALLEEESDATEVPRG